MLLEGRHSAAEWVAGSLLKSENVNLISHQQRLSAMDWLAVISQSNAILDVGDEEVIVEYDEDTLPPTTHAACTWGDNVIINNTRGKLDLLSFSSVSCVVLPIAEQLARDRVDLDLRNDFGLTRICITAIGEDRLQSPSLVSCYPKHAAEAKWIPGRGLLRLIYTVVVLVGVWQLHQTSKSFKKGLKMLLSTNWCCKCNIPPPSQ